MSKMLNTGMLDLERQHYISIPSSISESTHPASRNVYPRRKIIDVIDVAMYKMKLPNMLTEKDMLQMIAMYFTEKDMIQMMMYFAEKEMLKMYVLWSIPPEPKSREDFLQYLCPVLTLDPNTAHPTLSLSKGDRKVTKMSKPQSYPYHPERFTGYEQVMSKEGLTGRRYWEVKWNGGGLGIFIAASYKDIGRMGYGDECMFGYNDKSWALQCATNGYTFRHKGHEIPIPGRVSSRVGVYLDHHAGTLSFYSVSDTMKKLHRVHTTFTQRVHVGFSLLETGATAELCKVN